MVRKIILNSRSSRKRFLGVEIGDEKITTHGGLAPVKAFLDRVGLRPLLDRRLGHLGGSRYSAAEMLELLLVSKILGDTRMIEVERYSKDDAFKYFLDLLSVPAATTASRFLERMKASDLLALQFAWAELLREQFLRGRNSIVVDVDATPLLPWGKQEGIAKGYCPQRRGGKTYSPNMAFDAKTGMPLHGVLRPGNRNSLGPVGEFEEFLDFLFAFVLRDIPRVIFRADSGYYANRVFQYLEEKGAQYVVSARGVFFPKLKPEDIRWGQVRKGVQYGEFDYLCDNGQILRRFVVKRDHTRDAQARLDGLWDTDVVVVTNRKGRPKSIIRFYNDRGTAEQYIAEGKQGFGFAKFPSRRYLVNQIDFAGKLMAMGLLIAYREAVLPPSMRKHRPSTVRNLFVNVGAKLVRRSGQTVLRLTKAIRYRQVWDVILARLRLPPPTPAIAS